MRTTVEIDDELLAAAMAATGLPTSQAAVEEALRRVSQAAEQIKQERLDRQKIALDQMAGFGWDGDLDAMREGRTF